MVGLAQLVSASGCGPEGHGFESRISPHTKSTPSGVLFVWGEIPKGDAGLRSKLRVRILRRKHGVRLRDACEEQRYSLEANIPYDMKKHPNRGAFLCVRDGFARKRVANAIFFALARFFALHGERALSAFERSLKCFLAALRDLAFFASLRDVPDTPGRCR